MEPITIIATVLHQAIIALVTLKAKQDSVPLDNDVVSNLIDSAKVLGLAGSLILPENLAPTTANVSLNPLIDIGKTALQIAGDISKDALARKEFNRKVLIELQENNLSRFNNWHCPKSKKKVGLRLLGQQVSIDCPYLMQQPPLGCKVTWKKIGLAQLAFPPLIALTIMKAAFDFTMVSAGISPYKTYGYCCIADHIICSVLKAKG